MCSILKKGLTFGIFYTFLVYNNPSCSMHTQSPDTCNYRNINTASDTLTKSKKNPTLAKEDTCTICVASLRIYNCL